MRTSTLRYVSIIATLLFCIVSRTAADTRFEIAPLIWGARVRLERDIESEYAPTTTVGGALGAAFGSTPYLRRLDGTPITVEDEIYPDPDLSTAVTSTFLGWETDISRSLAFDNSGNSVFGVFAGYYGRLDRRSRDSDSLKSTLFDSDPAIPDAAGQLLNSVRTGIEIGHVDQAPTTRTRHGIDGSFTYEWAPAFLANTVYGSADFSRVSLAARAFLPLVEAAPRETTYNRFSAYAGAHVVADYTWGTQVPISARSSFGGRSPRSGLAGTVRGYESGRFDSRAKVASGLEIRLIGPSIGRPDVLPGLVLHLDGGYYAGYENGGGLSSASGYLGSGGAGVSASLFDAATLVFYSHFVFTETLLDGSRLQPFTIGFGYHF